MKRCTCKTHVGENPLPLDNFSKDKNQTDGYYYRCKACVTAYKKEYHILNRDTIIQKSAEWQSNNKDKVNTNSKKYRATNKEKRQEVSKRWREANRGLVCYHANNRRKVIKEATPSWANLTAIKELYIRAGELTIETGVEHHVHHIIPLQEDKSVRGLHCEHNLIILTDAEHKQIHILPRKY